MAKVNYTEAEAKQIADSYLLDDDALERAFTRIAYAESAGITPSEQKIAVIVGGQPGAGKTNCITNSRMALDQNCVIIDNDAYRNYHPMVNEIKKHHPSLFTLCTDQLSFKATPVMIDVMSDRGYNLIIHQTLKSNLIADDAITKLREKGYIVIVRALAVSDLESKMSMIERSQALIEELGYCRWVPKNNHDVAYAGLPKTVEYMQQSGKYDMIEILKRGGIPAEPEALFRMVNPDIPEWRKKALKESNFATSNFSASGARTPRDAVEKGRLADREKVMQTLLGRIKIAEDRASTPEEPIYIDEVKDLLAQYLQSKSQTGAQ